MADSTAEEKLEQLLKDLDLPTVSSTASSSSSTITSTELDLVSSSLIAGDDGDTPSSKSKRARSLAFLVLARLLQPKEGSAGDSSSPNIASIGSYIKTQLEETDLEPLIRSLATLSAVFQIDPTAGAQILQTDGVAQGLADAIELEGLSNSNKQPTKEQALDQARLAYVLAETFSNGLNAAACRPVIRNLACSQRRSRTASFAQAEDSCGRLGRFDKAPPSGISGPLDQPCYSRKYWYSRERTR
jgi:hypothetical protein